VAHHRRRSKEPGGLLKEVVPPVISPNREEPSPLRRRLLLLILLLALVRGLLYVAIVPPWQHYDEPTHFEYIRLIAERGRLPQRDEYDLGMRQEIASSMQAAGFWKELTAPTIEFWSDEPPSIGLSELEHPPLYYILLALPQLLVNHQDVETQLYVARLGSVLLYLILVVAAFGLVAEAFPRQRWLPIAVATFIVLLPPLTDLMSAVNNDTGAVAATSCLLWAAVRLLRRGPSLVRLAVVLSLSAICWFTKSTAGAVAVAVLSILLANYVPRPRRRWLWLALCLLIPVAVIATFTWGGQAAHWYSPNQPAAANRLTNDAVLGDSVLVLWASGDKHPRIVYQELNRPVGQSLRGQVVTLGAWFRTDEGSEEFARLRLSDGLTEQQHRVEVTSEWEFYAFTATIGLDAPGVAVYAIAPGQEDAAAPVYLDGVVLASGEMPVDQTPEMSNTAGSTGRWGGQRFTNLLQNGSAEKAWPGLRNWIDNASPHRQPASLILHSLWDWPRTRWVYGFEFPILFQSFWGGFGWNHLHVPDPYYCVLGAVTITGFIGSGIGLVRLARKRKRGVRWQRYAWGMLGVALLVSWGSAVLRIHPVFVTRHINWPVARYAAVAIVPTAALLCWGLAEIVPRRWRKGFAWLGLLGMIALDTIALWTVILPYYYG
jgi:hypothetical protein